jgi:Ca2+-transporting ATPase
MSVIVQENGKKRLYLKGAPDVVFEKCTRALVRGSEILFSSDLKRAMTTANDEMADSALRVLAFAYKDITADFGGSPSLLEKNLVFVGLEGMMDPPRKEAFKAVKKCVRAGIKTVMITGDHKKTAAAVARELGILRGNGLVVTGAELDGMSDTQLSKIVPSASVFARVSPAHKLRIVKAYKNNGNVVAMTGDGVNDAPAVKEADIGVCMGVTGTDVTKEASSVILLDDNFASMVAAVEEGRVIYGNIRKFIRYLLSCNIGEVLTMFVGMLMGLPVVLTPIQILWVNLVTDGLPAIALGLEPPDDDVMENKPRGARESVFSNGLAGMMIFRGCIIGLSTLGSFITGYKCGGLMTARTMAFLTLVAVQLIHVFECKSETKNLLHIRIFNNPFLVLAVMASSTLILSAIYVPLLHSVFGTVSLGITELLWVAAYSIIGPILSALLFRHKKKR